MTWHTQILVFILGTVALVLFAFTLVIFLITHKKKRFEHLLEKQAMENNYRNELLQSRLEVQEQSFKYFSEEIHDNIGQLLSIVKMQLYNIKSSSRELEIVTKATVCTDLLGKAISDLRTVSHTLNSAYVDAAGLAAAIQKDLDYICSAKELKCRLHIQGDEYSLGSERELLVFRIVQEASANAIKHGNPTGIDIFLNYCNDKFQVTINDNGTGFDPSKLTNPGLGLSNMQLRAGLLKGELSVSSGKSNGTAITLTINNPLEAVPNAA
jgi:hypothetical protein